MLNTFLVVFVYLVLQMFLVWLLAQRMNNPSIVDVAWPIGLTVSGLIYLFSQGVNFRLATIGIILTVWGVRLASYLYFTRIKVGIVDKRYLKLSEGWKSSQSLGFLLNFELQAFFIVIMSLSLLFASLQTRATLGAFDSLGIGFCVIGILGEALSDWQLQQFKQSHQGKVCNVGLWNYSRHPNYFFDWLTWCGFACFAMEASFGWVAWISPLLLLFIMTKITGPMTEQGSLDSRGEQYREYQRVTSMFFPWFKKI